MDKACLQPIFFRPVFLIRNEHEAHANEMHTTLIWT